jgi:hypothetical protein
MRLDKKIEKLKNIERTMARRKGLLNCKKKLKTSTLIFRYKPRLDRKKIENLDFMKRVRGIFC